MSENASGDEYFEIGEPESKKPLGFKAKIEAFLDSRYFVVVCLVLVATIAFVLGRLSKIEERREPVRVYGAAENNSPSASSNNSPPTPLLLQERGAEKGNPSLEQTAAVGASGQNSNEIVVASKNGTKYHYPWCAGAKQISDKNKITFNSIAEARASGYTPASNCKGLR